MKINEEEGSISFNIGDKVHVLYLPVHYFVPGASQEEVAVLEHYKRQCSDLSSGKINAIILPSVFDEQGNRLFEYQQFSRGVELPNIKYVESCGDILVGYEEKPKEEVDYEQNDKS